MRDAVSKAADKLIGNLFRESAESGVDDTGDADPEDAKNEINLNDATEMAQLLQDLLHDEGYKIASFEEAGLLTRSTGLVVTGALGKFQITIVYSPYHPSRT